MNSRKEIVAIAIAAIMIVSVMTVIVPATVAQHEEVANSTLKLYGEEGYAPPIIFNNTVDPFDPCVIPKDSITFNPAVFSRWHGEEVIVENLDSAEKVYKRAWYEPGRLYWDNNIPGAVKQINLTAHSIVEEYTYFLTEYGTYVPHSGRALFTSFILPISSEKEWTVQPGMDTARRVDLRTACANASGDGLITHGLIEVEITRTLAVGESAQFMDHEITAKSTGTPASIEVKYKGNCGDYHSATQTKTVTTGNRYYFDRQNHMYATVPGTLAPGPGVLEDRTVTFYVEYIGAGTFVIGKQLKVGDTFYVDGVRYDIPAIYVEDPNDDTRINTTANDNTFVNCDDDKLKYITIRTPLPKCTYGDPRDPEYDVIPGYAYMDWSVVSSQWLEHIDYNKVIWELPPFNDDHKVVDDIGIPETVGNCIDPSYNEVVERIIDAEPLEYYYVKEDIETRFHTNLLERLWTTNNSKNNEVEEWDWWHIRTMPEKYTEFVLPPDPYHSPGDALYNDFLVTTSFRAPNSGPAQRHAACKANQSIHDICPDDARLVFIYDAVDGDGIYVNTTIGVPAWQKGDVNNDGKIDSADAQLVSQHIVGTITLTGNAFWAADVNCSGTIDSADAQLIAQYIVGTITHFPC